MKHFLLLTIIIVTRLNAQSILNFDKRFVESEDKWVAFNPGKDGSSIWIYPYRRTSRGCRYPIWEISKLTSFNGDQDCLTLILFSKEVCV